VLRPASGVCPGNHANDLPTLLVFAKGFLEEYMSSEQSPAERKLAVLIVESLNLEDLTAEEIEPEARLFGGEYGLDSIDALELALAISRQYGVQLKADDEKNRQVFANLRSLSGHVVTLRA